MARVPCPKCGTPVEDGQTACPYCRRPLTAAERAAAAREGPSDRPAAAAAGWALAAAAAAGGAVLLFRARGAVAENARAAAMAVSIGASLLSGGASVTAPPPAAIAAPAAPPAARAAGPAALPADCVLASEPREEPPADPSLRAVYGVVYDLYSGCAVPRATVSLSLASGPTGMFARTDRAGRYAIQIDRSLDGVLLSVTADGYRPGQLDESDPPYRERPAAQRRSAEETASARDREPVPLRFPNSADSVRQDIVVVPGR